MIWIPVSSAKRVSGDSWAASVSGGPEDDAMATSAGDAMAS